MKKLITIAAALFMTASVWAQSPEKMSYQAVVRDAGNALVATQAVGMQISILQGGSTGTPVYVETQTPTTNANGLVSLEIGTGTLVSGDFTIIDWANDTYFIKTETDPTGGISYTITGTSQLMSVPYALHSKTAESITGTVSYTETDPVFGASIANGITATDTTNWNNHTVDTDTQLDSTGVAGLGYVAGAHTVDADTQLDESAVDGFVSNNGYSTGAHTIDTDTQLDSTGVSGLGYVAGAHTIDTDTQLDESAVDDFVANNGYSSGAHTDSTAIANMGFTAGGVGPFYLGKDTLGGIVYYIYIGSDGLQHGLIVYKTESTAVWQASVTPTGATRSWDGAYNTNLMTGSAAADYVNGLFDGGFTDWYLPSIDELSLLWHNRYFANKALSTIGGATVLSNTANYWSSTETSPPNAFYFYFNDGSASNGYKGGTYSVRAVRAF